MMESGQKRTVKVLVSCDPQGRLQPLMNKVKALNDKNKFDFMLMMGDVCHRRSSAYVASLRSGTHSIPLLSYFIDNSQMAPVLHQVHPNGSQLAPNLHFLGTSGIITVKEATIAYFSLNSQWKNTSQFQEPTHEAVEAFLKQCQGKKIDILMTNEWSEQVKKISEKQQVKTKTYVSRIAAQLSPHYHLAAGGEGFFRLSPYSNKLNQITHFISVAPFTEQPQGKYLFAFSLQPGKPQLPQGSNLQNPYPTSQFEAGQSHLHVKTDRKAEQASTQISTQTVIYFEGFPDWARNSDITEFIERWGEISSIRVNNTLSRGTRNGIVRFASVDSIKSCLSSSGKFMFHNKRIKFERRGGREGGEEDCWFCRSKADPTLIVYEGKHCYVCMEKGPCCPNHFQLIPFDHVDNLGRLPQGALDQISSIKHKLTTHFQKQDLQCMTYERALPLNQRINHALLHFLAVPASSQITQSFQRLNSRDNLGFKPYTEGTIRKSPFYLLFSFNNAKQYMREVHKKDRVQADIMRVVVSQLLNSPQLANWKQCIRTPNQLEQEREQILRQIEQAGLVRMI